MQKLLTLFAALAAFTAHAATVYVSPSGNDANDCLSPAAPCLTLQAASDKAGAIGRVNVAPGLYAGDAARINLTYYRLVVFAGDCAAPWTVILQADGGNLALAQDHAILTMRCLTLNAPGGVALAARQFAIIDYEKIVFGAASVHISASEMSKINCASASIWGNATYHLAASDLSTISATCPMELLPTVTFSAYAWAVDRSIIYGNPASFNGKGAQNGLQYINDSSTVSMPQGGFPGAGGICQSGCIVR